MLIFILLAQAAAVQAPTLWQDVRTGMSLAELQAVRPAARPITAEEKRNWLNGCDIADDQVAIDGVVLDVCYAMQGGRVSAVFLHSPLKNHGGAADRFKPALASKYGAPLMDVCGGFDRVMGQQRCNTVWKSGAVTVKADRIKLADRNGITMEIRAD